MAMFPVILGFGQKCLACKQRSNPRKGQGYWEPVGLWNGAINRCTKCGRLTRVGFFVDELLTEEAGIKFLAARKVDLERYEASLVSKPQNEFQTTSGSTNTRVEKVLTERDRPALRDRFMFLLEPEHIRDKIKLIPPPFIKGWVDPVAHRMTDAILRNVPSVQASFQTVGTDYLRKELGRVIVDGYIGTYLYFFGVTADVNPITVLGPTEQSKYLASMMKIVETVKPADVAEKHPILNQLLMAIVEGQFYQPGFDRIQNKPAVSDYLYIMTLNGVAWAYAETLYYQGSKS